jgi:hypothetical protein|eukprot:COSAG02_NODE_14783_length_1236_cov_14.129288_1_plen_115_part_10
MAWCAGNMPDLLRYFGLPLDKLADVAPKHQRARDASPAKIKSSTSVTVRRWWLCALVSPWLLLSPANIFKIAVINKPSPAAMYIVAEGMDVCQAACDIARMWGCLFWALQVRARS